MVTFKACNLLDSDAELIAHQVNCKGVMGSGVAKQIRDRWPEVYAMYKEAVTKRGDSLLGRIQVCNVPIYTFDMQTYNIVNMFAQNGYGRERRYTDYTALQSCLMKLKEYALKYQMSVAIPFGIGCGNGGGDWNGVVYPMILDLFEKSAVDLTICKFTPRP